MSVSIPIRPRTQTVHSGPNAGSLLAVSKAAFFKTVMAKNNSGQTLFLQMFDSATVPADGAAPIGGLEVMVPPSNTGSFDYTGEADREEDGLFFQNGIVACFSSTEGSLTLAANGGKFTITYI
ncbi:MAG: hypothetical protein KGI71_05875 [Patescibacteria group bacterium]|nr:hypothetical protein [Patescibacteria group bacterium]